MNNRKRILVAPLDWGLGHAGRCVPLIREIIAQGHEPILATDGRALDFLKTEFPQVTTIRLKGYHPVYPKDDGMVMTMASQTPKFFAAIAHEHTELKKIIRAHSIDLIISDNRYGLWTKAKPTVLITHQLFIHMPRNMKWMEPAVNTLNHFFIKRFTHCWVPDVEHGENLSGDLSHGDAIPSNVEYIGMFSRFSFAPAQKKYDLLVVLSGPEPQRTILEEAIFHQLKDSSLKVLIVRGKPEEQKKEKLSETIESVSHLPSEEMTQALLQSDAVICRAGYSSIMELASLKKAAILIPTPGQTEQEYLAERLSEQGCGVMQHQNDLNIKTALAELKQQENPRLPFEGDRFKGALKKFLETAD